MLRRKELNEGKQGNALSPFHLNEGNPGMHTLTVWPLQVGDCNSCNRRCLKLILERSVAQPVAKLIHYFAILSVVISIS